MPDVLVSAALSDAVAASSLAREFEASGLSVLVDAGAADPSNAVSGALAVVSIWSVAGLQDARVRAISEAALTWRRLVAVSSGLLTDMDVPARFAKVARIDMTENSGAVVAAVRSRLKRPAGRAKAPAGSGGAIARWMVFALLLAVSLWVVAGTVEIVLRDVQRSALRTAVQNVAQRLQAGDVAKPNDEVIFDICASSGAGVSLCSALVWDIREFGSIAEVRFENAAPMSRYAPRDCSDAFACVAAAIGGDGPAPRQIQYIGTGKIGVVCAGMLLPFATPLVGDILKSTDAGDTAPSLCTVVGAEPFR